MFFIINSPLYKALKIHKRKNRSSFHVPGHKNSRRAGLNNLFKLDYTETPDTDSLFEADGAILKSEKNAAKLFSAKRTLISAGGCTLCIQTMLKLCTDKNKKIIISRLIHKSAINTLALLDITPIWVYPRKDAGESYPGRVYDEDIEKAIVENPDASAVYITSPDYYGVMSDIKSISRVCKLHNIPLLVDSAHGSHLPFIDKNLDPISLGADMVAFSAHKTLPVLTGGAYLNICNEKYIDEAKSAMAVFGSTSPSYPIMASLDLSNKWCSRHAKTKFAKLKLEVDKIKGIALGQGITFPNGVTDPIRICLNVRSLGLNGKDTGDFFREEKIEPEYCDSDNVVLVPTPFNTRRDFKRLQKAILKLCPRENNEISCKDNFEIRDPIIKMSPRDAIFSTKERINVEKSSGRIAAECVAPCPPGIPVVMPGEEITNSVISFLRNYGISFIYVVK